MFSSKELRDALQKMYVQLRQLHKEGRVNEEEEWLDILVSFLKLRGYENLQKIIADLTEKDAE